MQLWKLVPSEMFSVCLSANLFLTVKRQPKSIVLKRIWKDTISKIA